MTIRVEIEGKGQVAEFPDGTDQAVIDAAIKRDFFGKNPSGATRSWDISGGTKLLAGLKHGAETAGLGIGQRIAEMQGPTSASGNPLLDLIQQRATESRKEYAPFRQEANQTPWYQPTPQGIGEMAGQVAVGSAIPVPGAGARTALGLASRGALQGATQGFIQPTVGDESVGQNTAMGGTAGGVLGGALAGGGKLTNALMNRLPPNMVEALSKRYGIRTTLGEATGNPILQKAETWLEGVPLIGLKGFREAQNQDAEQAAKGLLAKYIANPTATDTMKANRQFASSLFETLKNKVAGVSDQTILPLETRQAAGELLERYPDIFKMFQDRKRETILNNVIAGIDENGNATKAINFKDAWTLRDGLGQMIGQAKKKLAAGDIDRTTYAELSKVYGAINNDIDSWTTSIGRPDIREAIMVANDAYKNYVVKYDVIRRALDKAEGTVGAKEMFSPKTFSTSLKEIIYKDNALNRFSPQEIDEMSGLANLLQVAKRAGQFKENPPTGNRWGLPILIGGTATVSLPAAAVEGGVALMARFLTGTEAGKRIALSASKIEPTNPNMKVLLKMVYSQLPKMAATGATRKY